MTLSIDHSTGHLLTRDVNCGDRLFKTFRVEVCHLEVVLQPQNQESHNDWVDCLEPELLSRLVTDEVRIESSIILIGRILDLYSRVENEFTGQYLYQKKDQDAR